MMDQMTQKECIECGWTFPEELIEKLSNGESIYCEECGAENDLNAYITNQDEPIPKSNEKFKKAYTTMKSKTFNFKTKVLKAKEKLKKYIDKYKEE